jgi:hypothetical protein
MALDATPLLCPFIVVLDIFTLKKDIANMHYNNVPNNAPLAVYQAALAGHWLVVGLKTKSSLVDARLSKMEATIKNITSLVAIGNLAIN